MSAENLFVVFIILAAIFVFALIGYSIYLECRNPPNAEQARKLCQAGIDHIFRDSYESLLVCHPKNDVNTLSFPYKTPSNFYSNDQGFGLVETKNEGEIWLESLPHDSILVKPEFYFDALRAGYRDLFLGSKDDELYHVFVLIKDKEQSK